MTTKKNSSIITIILLLIIVVLAVHGISLRDHFVNWDDEMMVINNPRIMNLSAAGILHILNPKNVFADRFTEYYPIRDISYIIDYFIWGLNPFGYHLTNLLFEIANVILVFVLFQKLFDNKFTSALTAIIFATHPLSSGVVSWVSCRKDLMAMTFYLLAFICFVDFYRTDKDKMWQKSKYYIAFNVMFLFALLSKASALPFPGVIAAYMFIVENQKCIKKYILYLTIPIIIMWTYAIGSYIYSSYFGTGTFQQSFGFHWFLMFFPELFLIYTVKFLFPFNLAPLYIQPSNNSFLEPLFLISVLNIILIIYVFFRYIIKDKILFFGFAWLFLNMVTASNIISIQIKTADRFTYIALAGFGLILARIFEIAIDKLNAALKGLSLTIASISIFSYSIITLMLNLTWYNGITLWTREIQTRPYILGVNGTLWGYALLGQAFRQEKDYYNALKYTKFVLSIDPDYLISLKEMGDIYAHYGEYVMAINMYEKALKYDIYKSSDYIFIAEMYEKMHRYKEAIEAYKMAKKVPHPVYNDKGLDAKIEKLKELVNE